MNLREDRLVISKQLTELDEEVIEFTGVLEDVGISYVIVSGYLAILTGRSRSTEDIDIILEPLSESKTETLVSTLKDRGYWGMAMPLDSMYEMLSDGDRIRVAEEETMIPNFEVWFAGSSLERTASEPRLSPTSVRTPSMSAQSSCKSRTNYNSHRVLTASLVRTSRTPYTSS
ncbi:hypothetical protein [Haladaptatus paucihalophilus]|nr:hypothetical protein [Haladaptatus paucihalophilus]SHL20591.1 hypothetical protein SAMN05444342_3260 [Haladaptatus paucihalophilus DX253]